MVKSAFDNGGYRDVKADFGLSPAFFFRGWTFSRNGGGAITLPGHAAGDLIVLVGLYGSFAAYGASNGWTTPVFMNGAFVAHKTATSSSEVSGTWTGSPLAMYAFVFAGPSVSVSAAAGYNQFPYQPSPANITCPSITATDLSGSAMRFRCAVTRTQSAQAATWSTPIPDGHTLLQEDTARYNASRLFVENNTRKPVSTSALSAGTVTLASGSDYTYWSSATFEVRGE